MAAVTRDQIAAEMPQSILSAALDAKRSGQEDLTLLSVMIGNAEIECRAVLGSTAARLSSDPAQLPFCYVNAVLASVRVKLCQKGGIGKDSKQPYEDSLKDAIAILQAIADGRRNLDSAPSAPLIVAEPLQFGEEAGL